MERCGDTAAFPAATVPRKYEEKPSRSTLKNQQRTNRKSPPFRRAFLHVRQSRLAKNSLPQSADRKAPFPYSGKQNSGRYYPKPSLSSSDTRNSQQRSDTPARRGAVGVLATIDVFASHTACHFTEKKRFSFSSGGRRCAVSPPYDLPFQK